MAINYAALAKQAGAIDLSVTGVRPWQESAPGTWSPAAPAPAANSAGFTNTTGGPVDRAGAEAEITAAYQMYLGRTPSAAEIAAQLQGGDFSLASMQRTVDAIKNSPEAQTYKTRTTTSVAKTYTRAQLTTMAQDYAQKKLGRQLTQTELDQLGKQFPNQTYGDADLNAIGNAVDAIGRSTGSLKDSTTGTTEKTTSTTMGSLLDPITTQFQSPGGAPTYQAPTYTAPAPYAQMAPVPDFVAPTDITEQNDPGFMARLKWGQQAIENSGSARGTTRSTNTMRDLVKFGQDYASAEYPAVYARAKGAYDTNVANLFGTYNTNLGTQEANTAAGLNTFAAQSGAAQSQFTNQKATSDTAYSQAWQNYLNSLDLQKWNNTFPVNVLTQQQQLGIQANA